MKIWILLLLLMSSCMVRDNPYDPKCDPNSFDSSKTGEKAVCISSPIFGAYSVYDGASFSASGNSDSIPNLNETIRMDVSFKNTAVASLPGITGKLSTTSTLATIDVQNATKTYGDTPAGWYNSPGGTWSSTASAKTYLTAASVNAFRIIIPSTTANNSTIPLVLTLTDSGNNKWILNFNMTIGQAPP